MNRKRVLQVLVAPGNFVSIVSHSEIAPAARQ